MKLSIANSLGRWGAMALLLTVGSVARAQAEDESIPKGAADEITFQFLPPPLDDARYSIGVFDAKGKLVRRLQEGALESSFPAALNGLIVRWNAKDDAGKRLPNGKYTLRGFAVGPLKVTGVATLGNDWLADDPTLRIVHVDKLWPIPGGFGASVTKTDGSTESISVVGGVLQPRGDAKPSYKSTSESPPDTFGWKLEEGRLVQVSDDGKLLHELIPTPGEPIPVAVTPIERGRLYLVERSANPPWERVRGIESGVQPEWHAFFERNIRVPEKFDAADAGPTLRVDLVKNPLASKRSGAPSLVLQATFDPKGSYLATAEGLRLRQVSQAKNLKAVAMAKGGGRGSIRFFQRDAAVSEEFLIEGVDHIMALDVGGCEINERGEVLPAPEKDN